MYTWPNAFCINTNWKDSTELDVVKNETTVGEPIRRLRSNNIKHTLSIEFIVSLGDYNNTFLSFIKNIKGGVDAFLFNDITSNISGATVKAYISDPSNPYSIKRHDGSSYVISMSLCYYTIGGLL